MVLALFAGLMAVTPVPLTLVGRWDLTVVGSRGRYPAWFEIVQGGDSLAGRFQGQFGHATAVVSISTQGGRFRFVWPNEDDPKAPATVIEGRIVSRAVITGVLVTVAGARHPFRGVRAPALKRPGMPSWGSAIDLLQDGLAGWRVRDGKVSGWKMTNGVLTNEGPSADLISRRLFDDFRLHLEVNIPPNGNSGIYLRGRYEVQVLDGYPQSPGSRRIGGVYGQVTPTSHPAKPAGEWQTFDITLIGRRVTVVLNGVTIIDVVEIPGITGGALESDEGAAGPVMLQGDHTAIQFRNIRLEPARAGHGARH